MACALFAYVGAVTKSVVTSSFTCEWETTAQWAQALTEEGLLAVLEEFAKDKDPIEGFAERTKTQSWRRSPSSTAACSPTKGHCGWSPRREPRQSSYEVSDGRWRWPRRSRSSPN